MALQRTCVGIDVGTHAIKLVHLKVTEKGAFIQNALYFDRANLDARGVDPEDRAAVAALLKSQMSDQRIPTGNVVVSISGSDAILRYTAVPPVPSWRLGAIMEYEVADVAEKAGEKLASDYQVLRLPRSTEDDQIVLVGLCKEQFLEEMLGDLEAAGITVKMVIPGSLALSTSYSAFGPKADPDSPEDELVVLADVGRTNLGIVLLLNDNLVFARSVRFGGESFTEALARDLDLDSRRAEELKLKEGTLDLSPAPGGHEEMVHSLRGAAAQLQNAIQGSLRFCRSQVGNRLPEPTRLALVGGGARLRGMEDYLRKAFKKPVETFHPSGVVVTGRLEGEAARAFSSHPADFAVPIGLAVAGVQQSGRSLNILPSRYTARRRFRDRTIFLHAAGVLLVLNLICGFLQAFKINSDAESRHEELVRHREDLVQRKNEMDATVEANSRTRERIHRILREVEVTSFQAFVLDFLTGSLPPEVMLKRIHLDAELDEWDTDFLFRLVLEGTVDNANLRGIEVLEALRQGLEAEGRIASADVSIDSSGTRYQFQLTVTPSFQTF